MIRSRSTLFAGATALLVLAARPCASEQYLGVEVPRSLVVSGKTLVLNGVGVRAATLLKVKIYVGALYFSEKVQSSEGVENSPGPIVLSLTYLKPFGKDSVAKAWRYQFKESAEHSYPGLDAHIELVVSFFGALKKGGEERIEIEGDEARFYDQGVFRGSIRSGDFRKAFLSIWVGPHPPTKELKEGLLGLGSIR